MLSKDHIATINLSTTLKKVTHSSYISEIDREYVSRYKSPTRQNTTLVIRNLARELLFSKTGIPQRQWAFSVLENNSRIAVSNQGDTLHISFSHSPKIGAVAISQTPVGIDVEEIKKTRPWKEMIGFLNLPDNSPKIKSQIEFLHHWTAHEAQIKFESGSKKAITFHHYRLSQNALLCIASSLKKDQPPEFF